MNSDYVLACGIVWRKTQDPDAGWQLIEALQSVDPKERVVARAVLVDAGEGAFSLLEEALGTGVVSPEAAGACIAEILRAQAAERRTQVNAGRSSR